MLTLTSIELVGIAAAFCTTFAFIPQMMMGLRTEILNSLSLSTYTLLAAGKVSWFSYGTLIGSLPICLSNGVSLAFVAIILGCKLSLRRA
ncbi:MAG: PQ-loop domain-containing transporter [Henriciella sp.]|nr:PQ-loop domain-containing transporter [Henriciella sp.]